MIKTKSSNMYNKRGKYPITANEKKFWITETAREILIEGISEECANNPSNMKLAKSIVKNSCAIHLMECAPHEGSSPTGTSEMAVWALQTTNINWKNMLFRDGNMLKKISSENIKALAPIYWKDY